MMSNIFNIIKNIWLRLFFADLALLARSVLSIKVNTATYVKIVMCTTKSEKENVMKTLSTFALSLLVTVSYAMASEGAGTEVEGLGLMATFFIAFGVLIVMFQFIPGLLLLGGMLKGIFSPSDKKVQATESE
jgi:hypothetical protein